MALCPNCKDARDVVRTKDGSGWWCEHCECPVGNDADLVYVSGGGVTYHTRRDCHGLHNGKRAVVRRGGETAPVGMMFRARAQSLTKAPCECCTPPDWRT